MRALPSLAIARPLSLVTLAFSIACASLLAACGQPPAVVEVRLGASHAHPAEVREVWSTRFRNARDRSLLPIIAASATLDPPGLALVMTLRVPACDPATTESMRLAVVDLATARHTFAIHRVAEPAAETLATRLRESLGVDVHTPIELPGQVQIDAPLARVQPELDALASTLKTVVDPATTLSQTTLWVLEPTPALDGSGVATASADVSSDSAAIALTFTDAGTAAMTTISEAARGKFLVILIDGAFALAPRVMERVTHSLRFELPPFAAHAGRDATAKAADRLPMDATAKAAERLPMDATALARAIAASNLADPPTLVSSEARCATPR